MKIKACCLCGSAAIYFMVGDRIGLQEIYLELFSRQNDGSGEIIKLDDSKHSGSETLHRIALAQLEIGLTNNN